MGFSAAVMVLVVTLLAGMVSTETRIKQTDINEFKRTYATLIAGYSLEDSLRDFQTSFDSVNRGENIDLLYKYEMNLLNDIESADINPTEAFYAKLKSDFVDHTGMIVNCLKQLKQPTTSRLTYNTSKSISSDDCKKKYTELQEILGKKSVTEANTEFAIQCEYIIEDCFKKHVTF